MLDDEETEYQPPTYEEIEKLLETVDTIALNDPHYKQTAKEAEILVLQSVKLLLQLLVLGSTVNNELTYDNLSRCIEQHEQMLFLSQACPTRKVLKDLIKQNKVQYKE